MNRCFQKVSKFINIEGNKIYIIPWTFRQQNVFALSHQAIMIKKEHLLNASLSLCALLSSTRKFWQNVCTTMKPSFSPLPDNAERDKTDRVNELCRNRQYMKLHYPDRTFHNFRSSKAFDRRIFCGSETSINRFKGSVVGRAQETVTRQTLPQFQSLEICLRTLFLELVDGRILTLWNWERVGRVATYKPTDKLSVCRLEFCLPAYKRHLADRQRGNNARF